MYVDIQPIVPEGEYEPQQSPATTPVIYLDRQQGRLPHPRNFSGVRGTVATVTQGTVHLPVEADHITPTDTICGSVTPLRSAD